jgi:hypothetical protein
LLSPSQDLEMVARIAGDRLVSASAPGWGLELAIMAAEIGLRMPSWRGQERCEPHLRHLDVRTARPVWR